MTVTQVSCHCFCKYTAPCVLLSHTLPLSCVDYHTFYPHFLSRTVPLFSVNRTSEERHLCNTVFVFPECCFYSEWLLWALSHMKFLSTRGEIFNFKPGWKKLVQVINVNLAWKKVFCLHLACGVNIFTRIANIFSVINVFSLIA